MSIFPTRVLLASDSSEDANAAARAAAGISERTGSELHVVHAWQAPILPAYTRFPPPNNDPSWYEREASDLLTAQINGRVGTLFVASGTRRWGAFDPGTGEVDLHDEPEAGDGDLLDFAAIQTILNGGAVYVTDLAEMPNGAEVACLFRY